MSEVDRLAQDYRTAFLRFISRPSEEAMTVGYEIGRRAAAGDARLLDIIEVHHRILGQALSENHDSTVEVTTAAGRFLGEVLSTFDMAHRSLQSPSGR